MFAKILQVDHFSEEFLQVDQFFTTSHNYNSVMPSRHRRRKRRPRRRRRGMSSLQLNSVIVRGPSAFPDRVFVRLKYTNSIAISTSALSELEFGGNTLNRPDFQSVNEKCRGYFEWMNLYSEFTVHKSSIRVQVLNLDPALTLDCVLLPNAGTDNPSFVDTEDAREQPYAKSRRISPLSGNTSSISLFNSFTTKVIFGTRRLESSEYSGEIATFPIRRWSWFVYIQNLVNDVGTVNCDTSITMTYFVEFSRRKFIARSTAGEGLTR